MVSEYLFAIVATMMLSNGLVLAIMSRDLPDNVRHSVGTTSSDAAGDCQHRFPDRAARL
jgi:hypothetical protein